jgi:hypothetical protein
MLETIRLLSIEAEEGGFHPEIVWPADGPRYLVFQLVGDTTARGLAAAIELRETFNRSAEAADALFADFMSMGAVLHYVSDPQKLFPIVDDPGSSDPPSVGDEVIFLHDGPDGWAVLAKVEHIEHGGLIRFDVPAGVYLFAGDGGLQKALQRPDTSDAATLDTWLMPASKTNRAIYLSREYAAGTPPDQMEKLIRHSPPNGRAMQ